MKHSDNIESREGAYNEGEGQTLGSVYNSL